MSDTPSQSTPPQPASAPPQTYHVKTPPTRVVEMRRPSKRSHRRSSQQASASDIAAAIVEKVQAATPPQPPAPPPKPSNPPYGLLATLFLGIALAAGGYYWYSQIDQGKPKPARLSAPPSVSERPNTVREPAPRPKQEPTRSVLKKPQAEPSKPKSKRVTMAPVQSDNEDDIVGVDFEGME